MWIQMKLARYQVAIFSLAVILQRAPVVRHLVSLEKAISAPMAQAIRLATVAATALGGMHTYSGASTLAVNGINQATNTFTVNGMEGVSIAILLEVRDTNADARSWTVAGDIPPGLSITGLSGGVLNAVSVTVAGTPTEGGNYLVKARPWRGLNGTGSTTDSGTFDITFNIEAIPVDLVVPALLEKRVEGGFLYEWDGVEGLDYFVEMASDPKIWGPDARAISEVDGKLSFLIGESEAMSGKAFRVRVEN